MNLALARLGSGASSDQVAEALERGLRIGPVDPTVAFAAADLYARLGQDDRASELLAGVLADFPAWLLTHGGRLTRILPGYTNAPTTGPSNRATTRGSWP